MGYVFNFHDAIEYDRWSHDQRNSVATSLKTRLMLHMLKPMRGESLLDIGCGTGASLQPFLEMGLDLTGVDPSPYMLDFARKNLDDHAEIRRGFAEDLPFEDNAFTYSCLVTSMEFVEDAQRAIEEACRVTKDRIFIGVINRYAIKAVQRRVKGIFIESIYNHAHFYSIWELKQLIKIISGDFPIAWGTVCQFPETSGKIVNRIERFSLVQRCPFGDFIGMVVELVPRYRTTPLTLKYKTKHKPRAVTG